MNKINLCLLGFLLSSCARINIPLTQLSYTQDGKNCIYAETYSIDNYKKKNIISEKIDKYNAVLSQREIIYPNTQCSTVINSDLKNSINKTVMSNGTKASINMTSLNSIR